jgi:hypothetical protein
MVSGAKPGPQGAVCVEHSVLPRQGKARTIRLYSHPASAPHCTKCHLTAQRGRGFKGEGALRQPTPFR